MTMHYETSARKLHCADAALQEPDVINYSDVHRHNSRKIIAFTAPAAVPHPSMRSRHRRMARRQALQYKLLVTLPRCAPAGLPALWCSAYLLAAFSFLSKQYLSKKRA